MHNIIAILKYNDITYSVQHTYYMYDERLHYLHDNIRECLPERLALVRNIVFCTQLSNVRLYLVQIMTWHCGKQTENISKWTFK